MHKRMNSGATVAYAAEPALGATLYPNGSVGGAEADANPIAVAAPAPAPAAEPVPILTDTKPTTEPAVTAAAEDPSSKETPTTPAEPPSLTVDSYKDLKVPDTIQVDEALLGDFKTTLADAGVDPAKAPALLGVYEKALVAQKAADDAAILAQDAQWQRELSTLPEFQGERRAQSSTIIGRAIDEFGTPEVRSTLDAYGLGNNPALARFILRLASAATEGTPTIPGNPPPTTKDGKPLSRTLGARLYGDSSKQ